MKRIDLKKLFAIFAAVLLVTTGLFAMPAPAAYAQEDGPDNTRIELYYQREILSLHNQTERLRLANQVADKAQELIDALKAEGKDTVSLETGLATYRGELAEAQALYDQSNATLSVHAGFDENGKVTDRTQALQTLGDASLTLQETHLTLRFAALDFHQVIREWREAQEG